MAWCPTRGYVRVLRGFVGVPSCMGSTFEGASFEAQQLVPSIAAHPINELFLRIACRYWTTVIAKELGWEIAWKIINMAYWPFCLASHSFMNTIHI